MAKFRYVYRDHRPGNGKGKLVTRATYNRSRGQGVTCHIHKERVIIRNRQRYNDPFEFNPEDFSDGDLEELELHGTAETGEAE